MSTILKSIPVTAIDGFTIGQCENTNTTTGVTVILTGEKGAVCGVDVRGGGPASRENALLNPLAANDAVHAVVLSGGSAFGLESSCGVMRWLKERSIGFQTAYGPVPIVVSSCIFDLGIGDANAWPDAQMGYQACQSAPNFLEGNHGAGMGATVGKANGMEHAMKAGIGAAAFQLNDLQVGAIAVVNAFGDIYDPDTGRKLAGLRDDDGTMTPSCEEALYQMAPQLAHTNTTIAAILTNGIFNKTELTKIAGMGHDGYARAINPVHTMFDGDSLYALSHPAVKADINVAGTLAARAVAKAIDAAVLHTQAAFGLPCAKDMLAK
ncbi:MAG: P1 family peptidase [Lactimicrobium sp.]|jgi:L-aminopeptidase/D-esterase-like protein|uniref:P1 family peptidase n=1 Tax=Lactimicrobium sp. TaxID=2563780 RepID=UPI002F35CE05